MADPILGLSGKIEISTDGETGSTYAAIGELDTIETDIGPDYADISEFGNTGKKKQVSTKHFQGSCSGKWKPDDAGQAVVKGIQLSGAKAWIKYMWDGTNGYRALCALSAIKIGSKQGPDAASFGFTWEEAGGLAPVAVP